VSGYGPPSRPPWLTAARRIYKNIADAVGKRSYRSDINQDAIARASAIKNSQRVKKEVPAKKARGSKAIKAAVA